MHNFIAGCGAGVSQSCGHYAASAWSPGGIILGLLLVAGGIAAWKAHGYGRVLGLLAVLVVIGLGTALYHMGM